MAIARAMQSRCCWPPERRSAGASSLSATSSQSPARRSASSTSGSTTRSPRALARLLAQRVGDVVEDRHRERVGLLEDHRHAAAQRGDLELVDVGAVEQDRAGARRAGGQLGQAVQRAQQRRLAAARRADQREHLAEADRQRDLLDGLVVAVEHRQLVQRHALRPARLTALVPRRAAGGGVGRRVGVRCHGRRNRRRRVQHDLADRRRRAAGLGGRDAGGRRHVLGLLIGDHRPAPRRVPSSPVLAPRRAMRSTAKFSATTSSSRTNAAA